jgi:hypothetical protein
MSVMLVRDAYKMNDVRSTAIRTCNCYCYLILITVIILCDYYFIWESLRKVDFYRNTGTKWYIIGLVFVHNDNHPLVMTTSATLPMHEVLWREVVWELSRSLSCSLRGTLSLRKGIVRTSMMVLRIPLCRIICLEVCNICCDGVWSTQLWGYHCEPLASSAWGCHCEWPASSAGGPQWLCRSSVNDIDPEYGYPISWVSLHWGVGRVDCESNSGCVHIGVGISRTSEWGGKGATASIMFVSRHTPASDGRALHVLVDLLLLLWCDGSMSGVS